MTVDIVKIDFFHLYFRTIKDVAQALQFVIPEAYHISIDIYRIAISVVRQLGKSGKIIQFRQSLRTFKHTRTEQPFHAVFRIGRSS